VSSYQLTSRARRDLLGILDYIEADSPDAAARVESAVLDSLAFLALHPYAGHIRPQFTGRAVRFWPVHPFSRYLIVYDPATKPLSVIRIFHGARDLGRYLT
jgi:plasmid stabilization system protein ParE